MPLSTVVRRLRNVLAASYAANSGPPARDPRRTPCDVIGCDGTTVFDDHEWPLYATWICERNPDHRRTIEGEFGAFVGHRGCTFADCGGIMTSVDAHWPYAIIWQCDRQEDHREVVWTSKPCTAAGCPGRMRWLPRYGMWICACEFNHRELEPEPPVVRRPTSEAAIQ